MWRREGVRGAGGRSSDRDATQSKEGRLEAEVDVVDAEDALLAVEGDLTIEEDWTGEGAR